MKYFNTEQVSREKQIWEVQNHVLGSQVNLLHEIDEVEAGQVVFLSLAEDVGSNVRHKLFGFSQLSFAHLVDCGNYQGNDVEPIVQLIKAIWDREATVIIFSKNMDKGLYHAIHEKLAKDIEYSASITRASGDTFRLYPEISFVSLANQIHRGIPSHLVKSENILTLRLGEMRSYFAESEPYVRHADCCFFNLDSVRYADAPGQPKPSTSGLTSEEACHLARYAGQAGKMKLFWIHNYDPAQDDRQVTADLIAQILWYFCEGVDQRKDQLPLDKTRLQAYVVEFDKLDIPLTFYKSTFTDRWWVTGSFDPDSKPLPCSIRDYDLAKQGELSQRLLDLLQIYG